MNPQSSPAEEHKESDESIHISTSAVAGFLGGSCRRIVHHFSGGVVASIGSAPPAIGLAFRGAMDSDIG